MIVERFNSIDLEGLSKERLAKLCEEGFLDARLYVPQTGFGEWRPPKEWRNPVFSSENSESHDMPLDRDTLLSAEQDPVVRGSNSILLSINFNVTYEFRLRKPKRWR